MTRIHPADLAEIIQAADRPAKPDALEVKTAAECSRRSMTRASRRSS
jgi:hypothetical protein